MVGAPVGAAAYTGNEHRVDAVRDLRVTLFSELLEEYGCRL
jgi:hypothetical protein